MTSYSSDGYPYTYPIIWGKRPPSLRQVACVIRHPALMTIRTLDPRYQDAQPKTLYDNLSSIPDHQLTSSVTITITPPKILEIITLANTKFTKRID